MKRKTGCALLAAALSLALLSGCSTTSAKDLMEHITPSAETQQADVTSLRPYVSDFGVRLFQQSFSPEENTLLSPISALSALAMTANGAQGETLNQMEDAFGLSVEEGNAYMAHLHAQLAQDEESPLHLANSIWFSDREDLTVQPEFLQTAADYYGAGAYQAPFDSSTVRDINRWVDKHTHGMIPEIVSELSPDSVMYLVNALAFEGDWAEPYQSYQVKSGTFTTATGEARDVELMYAQQDTYFEDEWATGFLQPYRDGNFAFVALLPREGISVDEYVDNITGEYLSQLLAHPIETPVNTALPKFSTQQTIQLENILPLMGMEAPFHGETADFSALGTCGDVNLYINRVLHKTYINVSERGTQAGAATAVEMNAGGSMPSTPPKEVILDRPFVYLLVDCRENVPLFLGTMMDPTR